MERTKISYVTLSDDNVYIAKVEGAANKDELREEFGHRFLAQYTSLRPHYLGKEKTQSDKIIKRVVAYRPEGGYITIREGRILSREDFGEAISLMKAAGDRLREVKKQVGDDVIKEVLI